MSEKARLYFLVGFALASVCISPLFGIIPLSDLISSHKEILTQVRIPRVFLAFLVGGSLSVLGTVYQSVFRNPLASPYTLGVSAGASLGTGVGIFLGAEIWGVRESFAILGAVGVAFGLGAVSRVLRGDAQTKILLSGLMLNFMCASLLLFVQYLADFGQVFRLARWLMGSVETVGYDAVITIFICLIIVVMYLSRRSVEISLVAVGDDFALSKGVSLSRFLLELAVISSVLVGVVIAFCGPIGFVGVAVPFLARRLFAHRVTLQIWVSLLLGGALLTICDTLSRTIIAPAEIPVGILTALLGAPFVLLMLSKPPSQQ